MMQRLLLLSRLAFCIFATLFVLFYSAGTWAQSTTASLQVTVSDNSGAVIPGASVTVLDVGTGISHQATADPTGTAIFPQLAVGSYQLKVLKSGFSQFSQSGITLTVGQAASINVRLQVGSTSSTVHVSAAAPLVNTRNFTSTELVGEQQVVGLPLNGREAQSLVLTLPGTTDEGEHGCLICGQGGVYPGSPTYSINGTQATMVNYQLDGVSNNDTYLNTSLPFPNPDAIRQFVLQSGNFSAEYGNAAGGIVNIVSKSGTNTFHGSAFEFLRNGSLDAKNYFGTTHDSLHRNQFGGTVGGPILRNKLFFFTTYQGTRNSSASTAGSKFVPTAAERNGDFSAILPKQLKDPETGLPVPGNQIPIGRLDHVVLNLLKSVPLPNGSNGHLTYTTAPLRTKDDQILGKIDYTIGKNQFSGHYFYTRYAQPAVISTTNLLTASNQAQSVKVQTISINHSYIQSPTLLFNTTFGLYRQAGASLSSAPFGWAKLGANIADTSVPELNFNVSGQFIINTGHKGEFDRDGFTIREDVSKIIGRHELHFGGEALRTSNNLVNQFLQNGYFAFNGQLSGNALADFLYGRASTFEQGGGQYENIAGTQWALFAQDNWRATDRLTINAGLRWDPWLPYYDRQGRVVCFVPGEQSGRFPNAPAGFIYGGPHHDQGCPKPGSDPDWRQLGPRIGFAYRVTPDGHSSIRGGFGIYYSPLETTIFNSGATSAPFSPQFTFNDVQVSDPYGSLGITNPFPSQYGPKTPDSSVTFTTPVQLNGSFERDFRLPQLNSWNLIMEQQVGRTSVARLAYVGNKAEHLSGITPRQLNAAVYIPGQSTVKNTQLRRPNQNFSSVLQFQSSGSSTYNGLQASFETRATSGLTLLTSYTWSKCLANIYPGYGAQWTNPHTRSEDYGPCLADITNNFKLSGAWDIPSPRLHFSPIKRLLGGWEFSSIVEWLSGTPATVRSGVDNSFSGVGLDHADYLGGPFRLSRNRSKSELTKEWFDTTQFVPNEPGTFGTASSGQIRIPGYFNADIGLMKEIQIRDRAHLILRGEAYNAFNNVNFGPPQLIQSSKQFGEITSAADPRIMQLAMKFVF